MTELFPHFQVIVVSGLHDSGPGHWQSRWQRLHPEFVRVRQDDFDQPDLAAWAARLDQVRRADPRPALLVAHSFGCLTAVHSIARRSEGVAGALLVAPADPDKFGVSDRLPALSLDCPSKVVSSANDPWMSASHAALWARRWGSELIELGRLGHINADSGLGDWPSGYNYLQRLAELAHNRVLAFSA
ncbi:alpha/beta hydrolase [Massilia sp. CCM 8733]|uniref:Alpha/beta hydrolase n=1 Tax=Massilia mucilaginosa TaxID=2609282 RepID=A0ABX0P0X3_9BURK|nr:alpha/beta hydrolase [Massilia mucilaginosa]NHZ92860.1 alpha/beta hydrolase [Massilia mucilaginosa]